MKPAVTGVHDIRGHEGNTHRNYGISIRRIGILRLLIILAEAPDLIFYTALYVLNGKWKLPLIIALKEQGPSRFNELQRILVDITPRILAKELRELEMNEFVKRNIDTGTPVIVTYSLTPYSDSLNKVLLELTKWGAQHKKRIMRAEK